jgi:hypothetical protein
MAITKNIAKIHSIVMRSPGKHFPAQERLGRADQSKPAQGASGNPLLECGCRNSSFAQLWLNIPKHGPYLTEQFACDPADAPNNIIACFACYLI